MITVDDERLDVFLGELGDATAEVVEIDLLSFEVGVGTI